MIFMIINVNHNGRIYNQETKQFYPTFALTITVHYSKSDEKKKLDNPVKPDEIFKVPEDILNTPEFLSL